VGDLSVDCRIIVEMVLEKQKWAWQRDRLDAAGSGKGPMAVCCKHSNETSVSL
jgi:hypothetical protein